MPEQLAAWIAQGNCTGPRSARQGHVANAPADVRRGSYPGRRRNIMKDELTAWPDIARWRKAERERLIAARLAIPADARAAMSTTIAAQLDAIVGDLSGSTVSLYWP